MNYSQLLVHEISTALSNDNELKYKLYCDTLNSVINIAKMELVSEIELLLLWNTNQTIH